MDRDPFRLAALATTAASGGRTGSSPGGKSVHVLPKSAAIKRLCFDDATGRLRPNLVLVDDQGSVVFEINELGLKGAARDPARKLAVVWGDSVVFGVGWSWPCLIDELAPGWQFLNGGIEGDPYDNVLRRAAAFGRAQAVGLNIVMPGWHPAGIPARLADRPKRPLEKLWRSIVAGRPAVPELAATHDTLGDALASFVGAHPNTVLATMPTALNPAIVERDLSGYFASGHRDRVFYFAGDLPYSLVVQRHLFAHVSERNAIVRAVAQASGTALVDLAAVFATTGIDDFRDDFFDMLHLRPRAYAKAARAVYDRISHLL